MTPGAHKRTSLSHSTSNIPQWFLGNQDPEKKCKKNKNVTPGCATHEKINFVRSGEDKYLRNIHSARTWLYRFHFKQMCYFTPFCLDFEGSKITQHHQNSDKTTRLIKFEGFL